MLKATHVTVSLSGRDIIRDINLEMGENGFCVVMGPNGAGKTTFIRAVMRDLPFSGEILLDGRRVQDYTSRELARFAGVLSQSGGGAAFPYRAIDVIKMGRYAYQRGIMNSFTHEDSRAIDEAVERTQTGGLLNQNIQTLSGGELQRVLLAKLLAQDPRLLILDEPTNHLDFQHQINTFDILKDWSRLKGRAVLAIVHDFNIAHAYATDVVMLHRGQVRASGAPQEVLTRDILREVYNYDVAEWMTQRLADWSAGGTGTLGMAAFSSPAPAAFEKAPQNF